jgi:DNA-binding response OmpR family regulator
MKLGIHIIGNTSTFVKVNAAFGTKGLHGGATLLRRAGIETSVNFTTALASPRDITITDGGFEIIVVDGNDTAQLARLADMHQNAAPNVPVIATAPGEAGLQTMAQYCRVVSDWLFPDFGPGELAFRLLAVVTACQRRVHRLACGDITLARESRTMSLNGRLVSLSPSEVSLVEFFLNKSGQIVSLAELVDFFEGTGKSSAMNNIRVAIYQLRLKLEELSKFDLTIATVYRQGYVLRQAYARTKACAPAAEAELEAVA